MELDSARPASERTAARAYVDTYIASPKRPHAACMRAFVVLARTNPTYARQLIDTIDAYLLSIG